MTYPSASTKLGLEREGRNTDSRNLPGSQYNGLLRCGECCLHNNCFNSPSQESMKQLVFFADTRKLMMCVESVV